MSQHPILTPLSWRHCLGAIALCLCTGLPAFSQSSTAAALSPLVELQQAVPGIEVELRFATEKQFLKKAVYPFRKAWVQPALAERLRKAQAYLLPRGYRLKVWDAYRPMEFQELFWQHVKNENFISHPRKGGRHTRGTAIDLTLIDKTGQEIPMPTLYTEFSEKAFRDYAKLPSLLKANRLLLQQAMTQAGLEPLPTEWWHFDLPKWRTFPVLKLKGVTLAEHEKLL
ncbi:MAG: M15 family metallopeptidase [Candidatus Sericytochromatia bacterium]